MSPTRRTPLPEEYLAPSFDIASETVAIIKQILDSNDIHYKSKMLKAELVQLFQDKRPISMPKVVARHQVQANVVDSVDQAPCRWRRHQDG